MTDSREKIVILMYEKINDASGHVSFVRFDGNKRVNVKIIFSENNENSQRRASFCVARRFEILTYRGPRNRPYFHF